jgi:hypothetical protein
MNQAIQVYQAFQAIRMIADIIIQAAGTDTMAVRGTIAAMDTMASTGMTVSQECRSGRPSRRTRQGRREYHGRLEQERTAKYRRSHLGYRRFPQA